MCVVRCVNWPNNNLLHAFIGMKMIDRMKWKSKQTHPKKKETTFFLFMHYIECCDFYSIFQTNHMYTLPHAHARKHYHI